MPISGSALRAGKAVIELSLLDGPLNKQLASLQSKISSVGHSMSRIGAMGLAMAGTIGAAFGTVVKFASDAAEGVNKFRAVFGGQADAAEAFATGIANTVGRSATEIRNSMSAFQAFFVGLGFGGADALRMSKSMQQLTLDFASFHNISDAEASQRFISALSGSSEVLDMYGVNIKVAALEQEALAQGIKKSFTEMSEMEKTTLRLGVIMKSMTAQGAVGDAVKTAGSFANQMKALQARMKDTATEIGTALLPLATEWLGKIREIAKSLSDWVSKNHELFVSLATTVAKVGAASLALFALGKAIGAVSVAVGLLRTAILLLTAHPLVALATLVGAVALAFAHWMGWLDKVYAKMGKLMGMIPELKAEADKLNASLDPNAARREDLKGQIAANRAATGNPWGIGSGERPGADNSAFQMQAARLFNNLISHLPASVQAKITGAALPPAVEDALKKLGEAAARFSNAAAVPLDVTDAIQALKNLNDQRIVPEGFTRRGEPMFDTRLLQQAFGTGGDDIQQQQLKAQKQIVKNTSRNGGLPVI